MADRVRDHVGRFRTDLRALLNRAEAASPVEAIDVMADELAVMLLDVLSIAKEISICTGYQWKNQRLDTFLSDAFILEECRPIYEALPGWEADLTHCRRLTDLPPAARRYVERLSQLLGLPVSIISVGPDREQTVLC